MRHILPVLVLAFVLNGCMDLQVKMKLKNDWSGTASFELVMLDQMYQMIKMQVQQSGQDVFLLADDEDRARASLASSLEAEDARLTKFVNKVEDGVRTVSVEVAFKNGKNLIRENAAGGLLALTQEGDAWRLSFMDMEPNAAFQGMGQEELEQSLAMMEPMMAGLKMHFEISVPEVLETNMKGGSGAAAFTLSFDDDVAGKSGKPAADAFQKMMSPKWVKFKGMK